MAAQDLLDAINTEIARRLAAGATESYAEGPDNWRGTSLPQLYEMRKGLMREVNASSGMQLAAPFEG